MQFEYALINAMREHDLHINSISTETGKYHRFRSIGTCKSKCCEYRVFERELGAHFKCFRRGIDRFWFAKDRTQLNYEDRKLIQDERDRVTQERVTAQQIKSDKCSAFYFNMKRKNPDVPNNHAYVKRKGIYPHEAIEVRNNIVLPILNMDGDIMSLQIIKRNGFKQFKTGAPTAGGGIWLGGHLPRNYDGILRVCEGWATGCTIYSVTKSPVICALNAYNLVKVVLALRTYYIKARVRICADNDKWGSENVGLKCAREASLNTGYPVSYPTFGEKYIFHKPTDFNDLYLLGGVEVVKRQLILIRDI